jgi:hypothetical protein
MHAWGQNELLSALCRVRRIQRDERGVVLTMFYVDDGMVAARTSSEADALVGKVEGMFSIRKLGEPQDMLGIEIS